MTEGERIRLVVLFGGRSAEHEVSCTTAVNVLQALDPVGAADARILDPAEGEPGHAVGDEAVVDAHVAGLELAGDAPAPLVGAGPVPDRVG